MVGENKKELPVIIPIIVYHGRPSWNYKKDMRDMIPGFDLLPAYLKEEKKKELKKELKKEKLKL